MCSHRQTRSILWTLSILSLGSLLALGSPSYAQSEESDASQPADTADTASDSETAVEEQKDQVDDGKQADQQKSSDFNISNDDLQDENEERYQKNNGRGLLAPWRIGVSGALGFPHPLTYGLTLMYAEYFSLSLASGNYKADLDKVHLTIKNSDATFRFHPGQGSFFLGAAYGSQKISVDSSMQATVAGTTTDTSLAMSVTTTYLTPQLGWYKVTGIGLTFGFDFGYQIALSSSAADVKITANGVDASQDEDVKKREDELKKSAESFGKSNVFYVTFFRLGYTL